MPLGPQWGPYNWLKMLDFCADRLLLFPSTHTLEDISATRSEIPFSGGVLEIWKMRTFAATGAEPEAYILAFGGNGGRGEYDAESVAQLFDKRNVEVWGVNYPGYGGSSGPARLRQMPPAALAAFDAIKSHANSRPVFIAGRSIGTAVALHVAANRPVAGIILHSPVPLRQLIVGRFGWWNLWLGAMAIASRVPRELDSIANAARAAVPALFLLTGADTLVPPAYQRRVIDAYLGAKRVIELPSTGHNDPVPDNALTAVDDAFGWLIETPRVANISR